VKISKIADLCSVTDLAGRFKAAEESKSGAFGANIISTSETFVNDAEPSENPPTLFYDIEYSVRGRGNSHVLSRSGIKDKNLYLLTAQSQEEAFATWEGELRTIANSLEL
jgi:hypothetical protein